METDELIAKIDDYLRHLLALLDLESYELEVTGDDQTLAVSIHVPEEHSGVLIGRHGETLQALRRLVRMTFIMSLANRRLTLNVNDYRDQRETRIRSLIDGGLSRIARTGRPYRLYRLSSGERFFAHNLIATDEFYADYTSYSINDEDGERVLIIDLASHATDDRETN